MVRELSEKLRTPARQLNTDQPWAAVERKWEEMRRRPHYFARLAAFISEMRATTGRALVWCLATFQHISRVLVFAFPLFVFVKCFDYFTVLDRIATTRYCVYCFFFIKFCPNLLNGGIDEDRAPAKQNLLRWPCSLPSDRAIPVLWQNLESNV